MMSMSRIEAMYLHVTAAMVVLTGIVFAWMKYAMTSDDPFAVANHPWQPYMLSIHVVFAPLLVFGLGMIVRNHIVRGIAAPGGSWKRSGAIATLAIAPMVLSGYLMQVITHEQLQYAMRVVHWVTSAGFSLAYIAHQVMHFRRRALAEVRGIDDFRAERSRQSERRGWFERTVRPRIGDRAV